MKEGLNHVVDNQVELLLGCHYALSCKNLTQLRRVHYLGVGDDKLLNAILGSVQAHEHHTFLDRVFHALDDVEVIREDEHILDFFSVLLICLAPDAAVLAARIGEGELRYLID